jgi:hypothetical protein
VAIGEERESPCKAMTAAFDLRRFDPNGPGLDGITFMGCLF